MTISRWGAVAAVVGGLLWTAEAVLLFAGGGDKSAAAEGLYYAGMLALVLALAVAGYSLVRTAPVWLRLIPTVAFPLLVFAVWILVRDALVALQIQGDEWRGEAYTLLAGGVMAVLVGALKLGRSASGSTAPPSGGARGEPRRRGAHRDA